MSEPCREALASRRFVSCIAAGSWLIRCGYRCARDQTLLKSHMVMHREVQSASDVTGLVSLWCWAKGRVLAQQQSEEVRRERMWGSVRHILVSALAEGEVTMAKRVVSAITLVALVVVSLGLSGCAQVKSPLGSEENPIKLYFVPSVEVGVIVESGEQIADFIQSQTGYHFEVTVPTTYAAVIEELGAAEQDAMAFIPAFGYVLAHDKYDTEVSLATVRYGWAYYWAQYVVARDSDIQTMADLNGKSWAYPSTTSTSGYLVPFSYFTDNGIEVGEKVEAGGHPQAVTAVYEGSADFGTCYFSAPGDDWKIGDAPEPGGEFTYEEVEGSIKAYQDGQRIRDARVAVIDTYPDVLEKVRILDISDPIPNDTVSFCAGFPEDVRDAVVQGLIEYANTEEGLAVLQNEKFYDISGFEPVTDEAYQPIRSMIAAAGMTEEDILQ